MAKTNAQRVAALRARRGVLGHIRREYYATEKEHEQLKKHLSEMRGENDCEDTAQTDSKTPRAAD